jgi:hypothetical protein
MILCTVSGNFRYQIAVENYSSSVHICWLVQLESYASCCWCCLVWRWWHQDGAGQAEHTAPCTEARVTTVLVEAICCVLVRSLEVQAVLRGQGEAVPPVECARWRYRLSWEAKAKPYFQWSALAGDGSVVELAAPLYWEELRECFLIFVADGRRLRESWMARRWGRSSGCLWT